MGYLRRQLVLSGLAANALRPIPGLRAGIPSFFAGWLAGELAPHLLALSALDTAQHFARPGARRRARARDVAAGALAAGTLGWLVKSAYGVDDLVEGALSDGIGDDYVDSLAETRSAADRAVPWREVARPFRMKLASVERIANLPYTDGGSRAKLDVYRPRDSAGATAATGAPVLVQIHGGAWVLGNKEEQGQLLMNRMAARGWVCVAPNYRLAPKHRWPAQIVDVKKVLAWVREHIEEYGGDPAYVVITGGSAGGNLAALAALTPNDPAFQPGFEDADTSVAACVPFYGVYDMAGITGTKAAIGMRDGFLGKRVFPATYRQDPELYLDASPLARVNADAPDFFCLHGERDTLVPVAQARAFVDRLRSLSKATVTYAELPGAQHAFEIFGSIRSIAAIKAVSRWLEWHEATHRPRPSSAAG